MTPLETVQTVAVSEVFAVGVEKETGSATPLDDNCLFRSTLPTEHLGLLQILGIEPFGEPVVDVQITACVLRVACLAVATDAPGSSPRAVRGIWLADDGRFQ